MSALPPPPGGPWLEAGDDAELAALDWLLPGGAAGQLDAAWHPEDPFPAHAAPPPAAPPPPPLRCLDPSHAAGCTACLPPPPAGQEALWKLRPPGAAACAKGAEGPNGSCLLRAQLLATAQWNSPAEREALAAAEEARGDPTGVAPLLRRQASKLLLKPHMLCIARAWGYASDLWTRRGAAGSSRKRSRVSDEPSQRSEAHAAPVPRLLPVVEPLALSPGGAPSALRALWRPAAETLLGPNVRAFTLRTGYAFAVTSDADFGVIDLVLGRIAAAPLVATQVAWNEALRAHLRSEDAAEYSARLALPDGRLPLCMAVSLPDSGDDAPVEAVLRGILNACAVFRSIMIARQHAAVRVLPASVETADMSDFAAEMEQVFVLCRRFTHEALLVLQFLKVRGSCDDYMAAAADAGREIIGFAAEVRTNIADLHSWLKQQCAAGVLTPLQTGKTHMNSPMYDRLLDSFSGPGAAVRFREEIG